MDLTSLNESSWGVRRMPQTGVRVNNPGPVVGRLQWRPSRLLLEQVEPAEPREHDVRRTSRLVRIRLKQHRIMQAGYQQATDPFADPFGDRAQPALDGPDSIETAEPTWEDLAQAEAAEPEDLDITDLIPDPESEHPENEDLEADALEFELPSQDSAVTNQPPAISRPSQETPPKGDRATRDEYDGHDCDAEKHACEKTVQQLKEYSIRQISLDITPSFKPDLTDEEATRKQRQKKLAKTTDHTWRNRCGEVIARGRFRDFRNGQIHITGDDSHNMKIPYRELSDDDLCLVAAWWGMPSECRMGDNPFEGRDWQLSTMTWKASGLCHKPLYFEDTALERYGHTAKPLLQPFLSGAHFFGSAVTLPYMMGMHPPGECRYALGYYRPGSCAPRLIPPVPLSPRGALMQTGAVLGLVYIIP